MKKSVIITLFFITALCFAACTGTQGSVSPSDISSHTHYFSEATCSSPAVCSCGEVRGKALLHTFAPATCLSPKTCTVCSFTEGKPLPHTFAPATCLSPKTCTLCSLTEGEPLSHSFLPATCLAPQTCSLCSTTQGGTLDHQYTAGECTLCGDFSPDYCPKLLFWGDMDKMTSKKDIREITFEYRSSEQTVSGSAKIKVQGTSSLEYTKKNYTINFYESSDYSSPLPIDAGWGEQTEYCLKANWIDKTHARNIVSARLAAEVQNKYGLLSAAPHNGTIDGFPIEVYINGEFHGLYTMNIPKAAWMFGMDENNPNHIVICGENWNDPVLFKAVPNDLNDWTVEVGPEDSQTLKKVQRLVSFVLNSSDSEFKENIEQYLNLDSTLNYYILTKYCYLDDNVGKNMLLATYDGEIWYPSLYDLDTSYGANWNGTALAQYKDYIMYSGLSLLWSRMENLFSKELAQRYFELRESLLDVQYVMTMFDSFCSSIPQEVQLRETEKWNTKAEPIPGYPLSQIEEYLEHQIPLLDAWFENWR